MNWELTWGLSSCTRCTPGANAHPAASISSRQGLAYLKLWDRRCVVQEVAATVPSATDDRPPPTRLMDVCKTRSTLWLQQAECA